MTVTLTLYAAAWALAWFVLVFPRPRLSPSRRRFALGALGALLVAYSAVVLLRHDAGLRAAGDGTLVRTAMQPISLAVWLAPIAIVPLVFAVDLLRAPERSDASALRLVAAAGTIWPLYSLTSLLMRGVPARAQASWQFETWATAVGLELATVAAVVVLLVHVRRARLALAPWVGTLLLGPAIAIVARIAGLSSALGIVDLILPVLVTVAILRGGLFGVDVKLRFAISKSTIAATFIAVFFIASEAAQQFFGETFSIRSKSSQPPTNRHE